MQVDGNILNNYPQTRLVGIIRIGLSFAIAFSYPLVHYPARECFSTLIWGKEPNKLAACVYYALTYSMSILGIIAAIVLDDLQVILSLVGSIGGTMMVFILPGLFYFYLGQQQQKHQILKQSRWHWLKMKSSIALVVFGVLLSFVGVTLQFV